MQLGNTIRKFFKRQKGWECIGCDKKLPSLQRKTIAEMFNHIQSHDPEIKYMSMDDLSFWDENLEPRQNKDFKGWYNKNWGNDR